MADQDYLYVIQVDDSRVQKAFEKLEARANKAADNMEKVFARVESRLGITAQTYKSSLVSVLTTISRVESAYGKLSEPLRSSKEIIVEIKKELASLAATPMSELGTHLSTVSNNLLLVNTGLKETKGLLKEIQSTPITIKTGTVSDIASKTKVKPDAGATTDSLVSESKLLSDILHIEEVRNALKGKNIQLQDLLLIATDADKKAIYALLKQEEARRKVIAQTEQIYTKIAASEQRSAIILANTNRESIGLERAKINLSITLTKLTTEQVRQEGGLARAKVAQLAVENKLKIAQLQVEKELQAKATTIKLQIEQSKAETARIKAESEVRMAMLSVDQDRLNLTVNLANAETKNLQAQSNLIRSRATLLNAENEIAIQTLRLEQIKTNELARQNAERDKQAAKAQPKDVTNSNTRARSLFVQAARGNDDLNVAITKIIDSYGQFEIALGGVESQLTDQQKEIYNIIKKSPELTKVVDQLIDKYENLQFTFDRLDFPAQKLLANSSSNTRAKGLFVQAARGNDELNIAITKIIDSYGEFQIALGSVEGQLTGQQKEIYDIINQSPELTKVVDQLVDKYENLQFTFDRLDFPIQKLEAQAKKFFVTAATEGDKAAIALSKIVDDFGNVNIGIKPGGVVSTESLVIPEHMKHLIDTVLQSSPELLNTLDAISRKFGDVTLNLTKADFPLAKFQETAKKSFLGVATSIDAVNNQILQLIRQSGGELALKIGVDTATLSTAEQELYAIINNNTLVANSVENLTEKYGQLSFVLKESDFDAKGLQRIGEKQFIKIAQGSDELTIALTRLTSQYGNVRLRLGDTNAVLTSQEQAIMDVVNANPQLAASIKQITDVLGPLDMMLDQLNFPTDKLEAQAKRIFMAVAKHSEDINSKMAELIRDAGGEIRLNLNTNPASFTTVQKEFYNLIMRSRETAAAFINLRNKYGDLELAFNQADFNVPEIQKTNFSLTTFVKKIGLATMVTYGLRRALNFLFHTVTRVFRTIVESATKTATEFQVLKITLTNIIREGNMGILDEAGIQKAGDVAISKVRDYSEQIGIDLAPLAVSIFPYIKNEEQFKTAADASARLFQLGLAKGLDKPASEVTRALDEMLAGGQFRTLQQVFNVPDFIISDLQRLQKEGATTGEKMDALLQGLITLGTSDPFRPLAERSLPEIRNVLTETLRSLGGVMGGEMLEGVKNVAIVIAKFFQDSRTELRELATVIGDTLSLFIQLTTSNTLKVLERDGTSSINNLKEEFIDFQGTLVEFNSNVEGVRNFFEPFLENIRQAIDLVDDFGVGLGSILSILLGPAISEALFGLFGDNAQQDLAKMVDGFTKWDEIARTFLQTLTIIAYYMQKLSPTDSNVTTFNYLLNAANEQAAKIIKNRNAIAENESRIRKELEETNDVVSGELITGGTNAPEEAPSEDALNTIEDIIKRRLEIEKDAAEAELDLQIETQQKIVDAWRDYTDKVLDLTLDLMRDRADAFLDNRRDLEDIDTDYQEDLYQNEKESADKRYEIEKEYLRKLEDLRRRFQFDAQEAIRENDAIRFLQLRRQLSFDRRTAEIERDRDLEDLRETEKDKRDEIDHQRELDIAEARRDLDRKLEDIRIAYLRELQDARLARQRELRDIAIDEQRKRDELLRSYQQQLEEFKIFVADKETGVQGMVSSELELIATMNSNIINKDSELYKTRLTAFEEFKAEYLKQYEDMTNTVNGMTTTTTSPLGPVVRNETSVNAIEGFRQSIIKLMRQRNLQQNVVIWQKYYKMVMEATTMQQLNNLAREIAAITPSGRRYGGPMQTGQPYIVGENGPELVVPSFSSKVLPLMDRNNFRLNIPTTRTPSNTTNYNNQFSNNFSMLDPNYLSPGQIALIQSIITQIMLQVAKGGVI